MVLARTQPTPRLDRTSFGDRDSVLCARTVADLPVSPVPFPSPRSLSIWLTPCSFLFLFFLLSPLRLPFLPGLCDCVLVPFYFLPPLAFFLSASLITFPLFSFYALFRPFSFRSILPLPYSVLCPRAPSLSLFLLDLLLVDLSFIVSSDFPFCHPSP